MKTITHKQPHTSRIRLSLRVPKTSGQKAIQALSKRGLIDRELRFDPTKASLFIPLTRELDGVEIEKLKDEFGAVVLTRHSFRLEEAQPRTLKDALRGKLPGDLLVNLSSSYDIIGDIAILDFPSSLMPYEKMLAAGVQQVNKNVRVVLAKTGFVSGKERIIPTRHLLGENRSETIHKESGCSFKVDISRAYFSPRLSHEHQRVVRQVEPGEVVTDLFAGVGPFSVLIAKKLGEVNVNAVDANPDAVRLIGENASLNKVRGTLKVWLGDAREVVERSLSGKASRVIMNHPSAAKGYVDVACKALNKAGGIIHYYTFAEGLNCEDQAVSEFEEGLDNCNWRTRWLAEVRRVRGVSPMRWQVVVDAPVVPVEP